MLSNENNNKIDMASLLDFNACKMLERAKKELRVYDVTLDEDEVQVIRSFNDAVEVDTEIFDTRMSETRGVYAKKDGSGNYISIKNIRFNLAKFVEGVLGLMGSGLQPISIIVFILSLKDQIAIPMNRKQVMVYSILFYETKRKKITGTNIIRIVNESLDTSGYSILEKNEIYVILEYLRKLEIINIDSDRYMVNDKMYFMFS